jgi:hypothetical protein
MLLVGAFLIDLNSTRVTFGDDDYNLHSDTGWPAEFYCAKKDPDVVGGVWTCWKFSMWCLCYDVAVCASVLVLTCVLSERCRRRWKREWLQIHLSTAIVLMIVAGLLLGITLENLRDTDVMTDRGGILSPRGEIIVFIFAILFGVWWFAEWLVRRRPKEDK